MASGYYVYAILPREARLPAGLVGFGGSVLSTVPWGELAAVVSPVDVGELRPTAESVLQHERVVEGVRRASPALPVRFGTVLSDAAGVAHAMAERHATLAADLARLGDKIELGLSVLWDLPDDGASVPEHDRPEPVGRLGPGARYLQARLVEHRAEAIRRERAQALARELDGVLGSEALERRWSTLPTPRLAVRAAYLLHPARVRAFQEIFDEMRRRRPDLRFLLSGPWPPYSFVTPTETSQRAALGRGLQDFGRQLSTHSRFAEGGEMAGRSRTE